MSTLRSNFPITIREREVLNLISLGLSTQEIALDLNISTETVKSHRAHLLRKLCANNTACLVRRGMESGLI